MQTKAIERVLRSVLAKLHFPTVPLRVMQIRKLVNVRDVIVKRQEARDRGFAFWL